MVSSIDSTLDSFIELSGFHMGLQDGQRSASKQGFKWNLTSTGAISQKNISISEDGESRPLPLASVSHNHLIPPLPRRFLRRFVFLQKLLSKAGLCWSFQVRGITSTSNPFPGSHKFVALRENALYIHFVLASSSSLVSIRRVLIQILLHLFAHAHGQIKHPFNVMYRSSRPPSFITLIHSHFPYTTHSQTWIIGTSFCPSIAVARKRIKMHIFLVLYCHITDTFTKIRRQILRKTVCPQL